MKGERQRIDAFELWYWRILLRVPWTARRSNQSIPKEINPFIGRTDADTKAPVLWPPESKGRLIRKDWHWERRAGGQEKKGTTEDKMLGWHHWLNGHEFEQALGDCEGQGSLACCSSWCRRESNTAEQLKTKQDMCETEMVPVKRR